MASPRRGRSDPAAGIGLWYAALSELHYGRQASTTRCVSVSVSPNRCEGLRGPSAHQVVGRAQSVSLWSTKVPCLSRFGMATFVASVVEKTSRVERKARSRERHQVIPGQPRSNLGLGSHLVVCSRPP